MTKVARHLMSVKRPVRVATTPLVDQLFSAGVASIDLAAYGLRRLYSAATWAIKVRRASDNATLDIGFDALGNLDLAALAAFSVGTTATVQVIYDQSGNANNMTTTATTRELQIFSGGSLTIAGTKPRPAMAVTVQDSGYLATLPTAIASTPSVSVFLMAAMSNTVTSALPRFVSLLDATAVADSAAIGRAVLIAREGSTTPTNNWEVFRNNAAYSKRTGTYDQLDQVAVIFNGTNVNMYLNNGTPHTVGTSSNFSVTRLGWGFSGSGFAMAPGSKTSELIYIKGAANNTVKDLIHADQALHYGSA